MTKGLLVETTVIDTDKNVVEITSMDYPFPFAMGNEKVLLDLPKYRSQQFTRTKYYMEEQGERSELIFFISNQDKEMVKMFLESSIQEAMGKVGYEDAMRFRRIRENYGEELSELLVTKPKDPDVKQQLKRMLDF